MNSKKKKYVIIASICVILLIVIGVTYAYWTTTQVQKDQNVINTDCLRISYTNKTDATGFTLEKAFPISDGDGRALDGYTFTIKNECNTYVNYTVNMESLKLTADGNVSTDDVNYEDKQVDINYINTTLNDGAVLELGGYKPTSTLLKKDDTNTATAYDTRELETGALGPKGEGNDSIDYTLRMWLDSETPDSEMSKTYKGKISVWATPTKAENAVEKITKLAESTPAAASADSTTQLIEDDTNEKNLRYIGKDPDNYVDIGNGVYQTDIWRGYSSDNSSDYREYTTEKLCNEGIDGSNSYNIKCTKVRSKGDPILWRIIGVMNNVEGGSTKNSNIRIKIIRDEQLGKIFWDGEITDDSYNDETGDYDNHEEYNNWKDASLNKLLNEAFFNRTVTKDPNYGILRGTNLTNKRYQYMDFSNTGIREISRKLFDDTKWFLGGPTNSNGVYDYHNMNVKSYYEIERNTASKYTGNPDSIIAKVGLMYPSDYGYATSGGTETNRTTCLNYALYNWDSYEDCYNNDWLFDNEDYQWTITPYASSDYDAANVWNYGSVYPDDVVDSSYLVRPVLYLKSSVKIVSGTGTKENPYRLTV